MKKILLATSALVMTTGFAAAEITLSGDARMGIVSVDDGVTTVNRFSSRVRIVFTASGETDSGLSFGASMRADQFGGNDNDGSNGDSGNTGDTNGDSTVFISGAFGKLTMGDVSGAADALVGQVSGVGYGPNDDTQEINFIGANKTAVYYEYSTGALTFGLGAGQIDTDESNAEFADFGVDAADTYSIGVKYATDAYSAALAWETADFGPTSVDMLSLGGSATFGAATVKARVSDLDISGADTAYALSVDYVMGATTLTAFYTDYGNTGIVLNPYHHGGTDTQHIGIGASYDLGGGATVAGGYTMQNNDGIEDASIANLGLKFSF